MSGDERPARNPLIAEEAEDDDEDEADYVDSSDEDDEDAEGDEDNPDGFFVEGDAEDNEGDEVGDDGVHTEKRRKRKRPSAQQELDEEDFALLEENTGQTFKRGGQLKRLKKRTQLADEHKDRDALEKRMFGDGDEVEDIEDDVEDEEALRRARDAGPDDIQRLDDEMDDFIVPERGQEAEFHRYREVMRRQGHVGGISADAAQEIFEIFGSKEKPLEELLLDFDASQRAPEGDAFEDEDDEDGDEDGEARQRRRALAKRSEANDPTILERNYLTKDDDEVKDMDMPEREQLARQGRIPDDFNLVSCARWIYSQIFAPEAPVSLAKKIVEEGWLEMDGVSPETIQQHVDMFENVATVPDSNIVSFRLLRRRRGAADEMDSWMSVAAWQHDAAAQEQLQTSIQQVLQAIYKKHTEVPPIAMFAKELCGELLALRDGDQPLTVGREECARLDSMGIYVASGAVLAWGRKIRRWDVLWAVYNASHQWLSLQQHKEAKLRLLQAARERSGDIDERVVLDTFQESLESVDSHEGLEDWSSSFRLHTQRTQSATLRLDALSLDTDGAAPTQRRPNKGTKFQACLSAGLAGLAAKLVLPMDDFAQNVATVTVAHPQGYTVCEVTDDKSRDPESVAEDFVVPGTAFDTAAICLQGAEHMIVAELAANPVIRATVRRLYREHATVSSTPTEAGLLELDPFHVHGEVKRIVGKPIAEFDDSDQFLHMVTAEKKRLITVDMRVSEDAFQEAILGPFQTLYCSDDVHPVSEKFNEVRRRILHALLREQLMPLMARELRRSLIAAARQRVLDDMSEALWRHATLPPLRLKCEEEDSDRFVTNQRTMSVCYGPGPSRSNPKGANTHMVMLDARGYPIDMLSLPQLSGPIKRSRKLHGADGGDEIYDPAKDPSKGADIEKMQTFIKKHWPHLIVVGASSLECRQLLADIKKVTETFNQEDLIERLEDTKTIDVRFVEETVAALCEESAFALEDLKEFSPIVRRAVALGRTIIDPLPVLCSLAGPGREVLSLPLHPLQEFVPEDDRWRALEQLLITAVAQVGAPINAMVHIDWLAQPLQFVPGLGPRKARALIKAIKHLDEPVIEDRENLLALGDAAEADPEDPFLACRVLHKVVYKNAAPYLRILQHEALTSLSHRDFDLHNDTRCHPDHHELLLQLARVTLNKEPDDESITNPVLVATHRKEDIMQLDVHQFNAVRMEAGTKSCLSVLIDLQMELMEPYGELRPKERAGLTEAEEFYGLTGESARSLMPGKLIQATVIWVGRDMARARLDNGLIGTIDISDVKCNPPSDMKDVLKPTMEVAARIVDTDYTSFTLRLVTRSDALQASDYWESAYFGEKDPYYKVLTQEERAIEEQAKKAKAPGRRPFISRPINHPLFQNISMKEATQRLNDSSTPDGTVIFRPCQKSTNRLSLSMRLFTTESGDPIVHHIDIHEAEKRGGAGAHLRLATPLTIPTGRHAAEDITFEDLDEVFSRYVEPYMKSVRAVQRHKKFVMLPEAKLDESLRAAATSYDYRLGLAHDKPGMGFISWVSRPRGEAHHCRFQISHMGYYLALPNLDGNGASSANHRNVDKLVHAFKVHMEQMIRHRAQLAAHAPRGGHGVEIPYSQPHGGSRGFAPSERDRYTGYVR